MNKLILFGAALLAMTAARADDAALLHGAWTGKIGNSSINACFGSDTSYFYLKHLHGIRLEGVDGDPNSWKEQVKDPKSHDWISPGSWKITSIAGDRLTGEWTGPDKAKGAAIELTRLPAATEGDDCGTAFYAPIAANNKERYRNEKVGNLRVKISSSPLGDSFELEGSNDAVRKINAYTASRTRESVAQAYFCETNGGGGWINNLSARRVLANYLFVTDDVPDVYCGGVYSSSAHSTLVFDLRTGELANADAWLSDSDEISQAPPYDEPAHPLRQMIMKKADACATMQPSIHASHPSASGLVFDLDYPHADRACNQSVEISYAKLKPYLSKAGMEVAASLKGKR